LGQRHALLSVTRGGVTRQFTYDPQGRLASTFLGTGEQLIQYDYGLAGSVTVTDAKGTSQLFFDQHGSLAKTVDPLGNMTTAEYDNDLRLSRLVLPTGDSRSFTWCDCGSPAGCGWPSPACSSSSRRRSAPSRSVAPSSTRR
jgi:YD repeat-containing protein